jgi:hypothetical protein
VTLEIGYTNSKLEILEANVIGEFVAVKGELASLKTALNQWLKQSHRSPSYEQPSHYESEASSHNMAFHSNSLHHDPCLPKVEVKKFDGLDPTVWVTQMEHFFSLHGINDDLTKFSYDVLYLDLEHWQWWKWCRKMHQWYVAWT